MGEEPDRPHESSGGDVEPVVKATELSPEDEARDRAAGRQMLKEAGSYGAIGLEFGFSVVIGYFIGSWLDQKLGTGPWLMLLFIGFGVASATRRLIRVARRASRKLSRREDE